MSDFKDKVKGAFAATAGAARSTHENVVKPLNDLVDSAIMAGLKAGQQAAWGAVGAVMIFGGLKYQAENEGNITPEKMGRDAAARLVEIVDDIKGVEADEISSIPVMEAFDQFVDGFKAEMEENRLGHEASMQSKSDQTPSSP